MKKGLLLAALACAPVALHAENEVDASTIEVVHVTVTLYRDKTKYDTERWTRLVNPILALSHEETAQAENVIELFDTAAHCMRSMTRGEDTGIRGEISAMLSDGQCSTRCAEECPCKASRGVCLCSVRGTSCEESCGCPGEDPADDEDGDIFCCDEDDEGLE